MENIDTYGIQFKLYKNYIHNHSSELSNIFCSHTSHDISMELGTIKRLLKQPSVTTGKYVKTKDAANFISVDPSFLIKRMGNTFIEGVHYFKPEDESIVRWNLEELEKWITSQKREKTQTERELESLLERC